MRSARAEIRVVDPQGDDALWLLRHAALEARDVYPELHVEGAPWPGNPPTPPGGTYLVAYESGMPIACGALRPIDTTCVEVRRMYVLKGSRREGIARKLLAALQAAAAQMGYRVMRLETGDRQRPAIALYESFGFQKIAAFGEHVNDPTSICYEKQVDVGGAESLP